MAEPIEQPYEYKPPVYERELVRFIPSPMMTQYHEGLQRKYEEDRRDWRKLHPDRDYKSLTTKEDEHAESKEDCSMEQNKEETLKQKSAMPKKTAKRISNPKSVKPKKSKAKPAKAKAKGKKRGGHLHPFAALAQQVSALQANVDSLLARVVHLEEKTADASEAA